MKSSLKFNEDVNFNEQSLMFLSEKGVSKETILKIHSSTRIILNLIINETLEISKSQNQPPQKPEEDLKKEKAHKKSDKDNMAASKVEENIISAEDMQPNVIYKKANYKYVPIGVSQTKLLAIASSIQNFFFFINIIVDYIYIK